MKHVFKALACAAALAFAAPGLAQNTIKIGVITDKIGPAKPYAEPVAQAWRWARRRSTPKAASSGARSSS